MTGTVICNQCGLAGHTQGRCPLTARPHVADRPRRCRACNAPILLTVADEIVDERSYEPHACAA